MKNLLFAILLGTLFVSCSKVPAGNVGIKFYLLGKDKGVDYEVLTPGRYWIGINEELYLFPTFRQNKVWTSIVTDDSPVDEHFEFQSNEGMKLTADMGIEYQIDEANVSKVFEMYKKGCDEITNIVLRNAVRDALNVMASKRTAEQMYGEGKVDFVKDVKTMVKEKASEKNITVIDLYLLGNLGVPSEVTNALNAKITAKQRAEQRENELRETEAQAKKDVAKADGEAQALLKRSKAEAEANRIISNSLTSTLVEYEKVKQWNGILPQVQGSGIPVINLK